LEITLFTYDRPHWKTERFLQELIAAGETVDCVVGAPWKQLNLPPAARTTVKHLPRPPRDLCRRYGIEYVVQPHGDYAGGELGIVGGARILSRRLIDRFDRGILNLHPGLIPENRGLSNITRAIRDGMSQAVTAHLIDARVDAGRVLFTQPVEVEPDDTIWDVGEKVMDAQVLALAPALNAIRLGQWVKVPKSIGPAPKPIPRKEEESIIASWH